MATITHKITCCNSTSSYLFYVYDFNINQLSRYVEDSCYIIKLDFVRNLCVICFHSYNLENSYLLGGGNFCSVIAASGLHCFLKIEKKNKKKTKLIIFLFNIIYIIIEKKVRKKGKVCLILELC